MKSFFALVFITVIAGIALSSPAKDLLRPKDVVPEDLDAKQIQELKDAWTKDGMPTLQVVVGQDVGGTITDQHTPLETQLSAAVREQLGKAVDPAFLVDATALWTQQMRDLTDTANASGKKVADAVADEVRNDPKATLVLFVHLQPAQNQYAVTMEVVDPARAAQLAATPFLQIDPATDVSRINAYAASIVGHFADQYAARIQNPDAAYAYHIRIIGVETDEDADSIATGLKKMNGLVGRVDHTFDTAAGDIGLATYSLAVKDPDPDPIKEALLDAVKSNLDGYSFFASRSNRGSVIGSVLKTKKPKWYTITSDDDDDEDKLEAATTKREKALGLSRRPKIAVVIGPALDDPAGAVENASTPLKTEFDDAALRDSLQSIFRTVGFDSVDDVSLKDAKQLAQQQDGRFMNFAHLAEAADDKKDFEYLLYGDLKTDNSGKRYQFRLIDRESGTVVGTQGWPDDAALQVNPRYRPKVDQVKSVARYVCGNLVHQLDQRMVDKTLTMKVVVKNVDDVVKIAKIADVFKNLPDAKVDEMNFSLPIGGFEVNYEGSADALLAALTAQIPKLDLPLSIDTFGDRQLLINLMRVVGPEKSATQKDQEVKAVVDSPKGQTLQQHLLAARSSVWVVGWIKTDGSFQTTGTAWTVGAQKLATNMHVAEGLLEEGPQGGVPAARRGDDESVIVKLGQITRHPGYAAWNQLTNKFNSDEWSGGIVPVCDVAIIDVADGDAGKPLAIASAETMNALLPGDSIGYLGFPMENKGNVAQLPTLMTDIGTVSAYSDVFHQPRQKDQLGLLQYTLRTSGGSSGSPVFNMDGNVIALNSAGDSLEMLKSVDTPGKYTHVVIASNHQAATKDGKLLIAVLNRPGTPVQVSDAFYQVQDENASVTRSLEKGEAVIPANANEVTFDKTGVVTAINDVRRVNFGFSYGQSVDMLRELLDGTANAKQPARTAAWEKQARDLHLIAQ